MDTKWFVPLNGKALVVAFAFQVTSVLRTSQVCHTLMKPNSKNLLLYRIVNLKKCKCK